MIITGYDALKICDTWHCLSLGGGTIKIDEFDCGDELEIYEENNFEEIKQYINKYNIDLLEYVYSKEPDLKDYLKDCLKVMFEVVDRGISLEGLINEPLKYYSVAKKLYEKAKSDNDYLVAYSYAANEENAAGGMMCTCPTLGACGILTSLMYFLRFNKNEEIDKVVKKYLGKRYSKEFINFINNMIDANEDTRSDFIELEQKFNSIFY